MARSRIGEKIEKPARSRHVDLDTQKLPTFLDHTRTRSFMERLRQAAASDGDYRRYRAVVRSFYDSARELEQLYAHLPGVLGGDRSATKTFTQILNYAAGRVPLSFRTGDRRSGLSDSLTMKMVASARPCGLEFLIWPDRIHALTFGIERVAAGDSNTAKTYRQALRYIWTLTQPLDRLLTTAMRSDLSGGRDILADEMDLLVRDHIGDGDRNRNPAGPEQPVPDEGFPRPGPDGMMVPPDPVPPLPDVPPDFCEQAQDLCRELIAEGLAGVALPTSVWADTITSIEFLGCEGETARIVIHGDNFGAVQPPNVVVLVDYEIVVVLSWSNTRIEVAIASDMPSGCVGFRDEAIEAQRRAMHEQAQRAWNRLNLGLRCLEGSTLEPARLPYSSSKAPCTPFNAFLGTLPEIVFFRINGGSDIQVARGTPLHLTWRVNNAEESRIRRVAPAGGLDILNPAGNTLEVGAGVDGPNVRTTFELTAINGCGAVSEQVSVTVRREANLQILGIEATQVIQRFNLNQPEDNNTVSLVAHKDTVLRVYLDSGRFRELPDVTGRVTLHRAGDPPDVPGIGFARPFNRKVINGVEAVGFFDAPGRFGASAANIDRNDLDQTLNFLLPFRALEGEIEARFDIYENGRQGDTTWGVRTQSRITLEFVPRRNHDIVVIPISHSGLGVRAPTRAEIRSVLRAVVARLPMAEDAFIEHFINGDPNFAFDTDRDLGRAGNLTEMSEPWGDLFNDIENLVDHWAGPNKVAFGLLVDDPAYNFIGGAAKPPKPVLLSKIFANPAPHTKARALAHEFTHTFGVWHADCPGDPGEDPIDSRLPRSTSDDVGINTNEGPMLVPKWTRELMCWYHDPDEPAWTSIALWNTLFGEWA